VLPLSTVECERTFSEQSRTKTKLRSSMGNELLGALLQLSINQAKSENFIKRCIIRWKEEKQRYFLQPAIQENKENKISLQRSFIRFYLV